MVGFVVDAVMKRLSSSNIIALALLLGTAIVCALIAYWQSDEEKSLKTFFGFMLPVEILVHPSAKADAMFWVTRRVLAPFILLPAGLSFVALVGTATNVVLGHALDIHAPVLGGPAGPGTICIFTVTMLIAYDLSYYLYHLAQHHFPVLWELHKVHHSAEVMVGITKDRVHPLDDLMNRLWDGVIPGVCFGLWTLIALDPVEVTIFGVNVYIIRNILMMDFIRHTHLAISFGRLNHLVLCPHWHQLHHSTDPRHYDKNFGLLFSFWDRLFGTLCVPQPREKFEFGLIDRDVRDYQSLFGLYVLPLVKMGRHIAGRFTGRYALPAPPAEGSQS